MPLTWPIVLPILRDVFSPLVVTSAPPSTSRILLEDGSFVLQEDGTSKILKEP